MARLIPCSGAEAVRKLVSKRLHQDGIDAEMFHKK